MANLNKVMLIGRLTRDPESRATAGGTTVVNFGLAVNRTYTRRDSNERVEETCFVDCEAWGKGGEILARYMRKGRQLFVEGRLKLDTWERDGQRRSRLSVVVENFQFLDGGNGGDEGSRPAPARVGSRSSGPGGPGQGPDDFGGPSDDDIPF